MQKVCYEALAVSDNEKGLRKFKKQKLEAPMFDTPILFIRSTTAQGSDALLLFKFPLIWCYLSVFFNSIFSLRGGKKDFNFLISKYYAES